MAIDGTAGGAHIPEIDALLRGLCVRFCVFSAFDFSVLAVTVNRFGDDEDKGDDSSTLLALQGKASKDVEAQSDSGDCG